MIAKFRRFEDIMRDLDDGISRHREDLEWYKFKVKQISARLSAKSI